MADTGRTVWADGFWADDFWAVGFWATGQSVTAAPEPDYTLVVEPRIRTLRLSKYGKTTRTH